MAHYTSFLLSALVAFHFQFILSAAAPLNHGLAVRNVIWQTSTIVTSVEATVTDVVTTFLPPSVSAAATTASEPRSTVTSWETTTVTNQPPTTTTNVPPAPSSTQWTLPEMFTDLTPFNIEKLAYGSKNIAVVTGIPARASATPASATGASSPSTAPQLPRPWTNSSSAYRVLYPAGSINPGNKPQGGSDFYASPGSLPFDMASNVTLEYSIFFPADFAWVQGGKLPGLYGGHEGCSGGNDAKSCFSTRLMWRKGGAGELYLYAPKDKQTPELCNTPPQSACDANYGLSVGRGSFHFAAGAWTHVSQTVRLNTPGKQDGGFELVVNGQQVIRRDDVFYRDVPSSPDGNDGDSAADVNGVVKREESQLSFNAVTEYDTPPPLLPLASTVGNILGDKTSAQAAPLFAPAAVPSDTPSTTVNKTPAGISDGVPPLLSSPGTEIITLTSTVTSTQSLLEPVAPSVTAAASQGEDPSIEDDDGAVRFSGIFFSTFFGGHEKSWASPRDQYTWFKDFGVSINA